MVEICLVVLFVQQKSDMYSQHVALQAWVVRSPPPDAGRSDVPWIREELGRSTSIQGSTHLPEVD
jgi:hypothetical protein